jgi:membrane protease YdiL (CAAX protease family)
MNSLKFDQSKVPLTSEPNSQAQALTETKPGFRTKQLALAIAKSLIFLFVAIYGGQPLIEAISQMLPYMSTQFTAYLIWGLLLLWLVGRFIEKRSLSDYGLTAKSFWAGLTEFYDGSLIGSLMVTTVTIILAALGCYEALAINTHCQLLELVPGLIAAAIFEEILFRGYVLQTIERASNTKIAVIASSLLFGAAHINNFQQGVPLFNQMASCTALGLDAGLLFCAAYLYTRRLWLAAGLHAFWNIFEGPVFGTPVSGMYMGEPLIFSGLNGPPWLTGGVFGPEASIVELIVCLLLAWAIWRRRVGADKVS